MSEPASDATSFPAPPPRRSFSSLVTVVCTIVVLLYVGLLGRPLVEPQVSRLAELDRPAESLERLVTRELDLRAAMRGGLRWEWRLYRALSGDEDPLAEAAGWYEELLDVTDSPGAELYHVILLAEGGRAKIAQEEIAGWDAASAPGQRKAEWVTAAYLEPPPDAKTGRALIAEIDDGLPDNWFSNTLTKRIATRVGDGGARSRAEAAILARGRALLFRARALMAVSLALLVLGALALVWMLWSHRRARIADADLPPIWSGERAMRSSCGASARPRPSPSSPSSCSAARPASAPRSAWPRTCRSSGG